MRVRAVTPVVVALGVIGNPAVATGDPITDVTPTIPPVIAPPPIHKSRVATAPVSVLQPGAPVMVGVDTPDDDSRLVEPCQLGFYVDFAGSDGQRRPGFLTAGPCAQGDSHAPVFVTKTFVYKQRFEQTKIGEISYLDGGDVQPTIRDQPWTVPTSPLAVVSSPPDGWPLSVTTDVMGRPPTERMVANARSAWRATATWNDGERIVTGRVLDPPTTPELANIPTGIERVVIAADDPTEPLYPGVRGAPVTAQIDGATENLGIIVAVDPDRHRVVVDLVGSFLAARQAQLRTAP